MLAVSPSLYPEKRFDGASESLKKDKEKVLDSSILFSTVYAADDN